MYQTHRGSAVPSVTEVVSVADRRDFSQWIARVGKAEAGRITDNAKVLGTKVHAAAVSVAAANGGHVYLLDEIQPFGDAVGEFLNEWVDEVIHTELSLTSERLRFGGTLDLYCRLKDQSYAVVDYKVVSQLSRDHGLQLCAYALLLREHGYSVNRRIAVRLRKDQPGRYSVREYKNHREDLAGWNGALELWYWQRARALEKAERGSEG